MNRRKAIKHFAIVSGGLNNALGNINKGGSGNTTGGGQQGTANGQIDGNVTQNTDMIIVICILGETLNGDNTCHIFSF